MPHFSTIAEFLALTGPDAPTDAEHALITACREGTPCILGDGTLPDGPAPDRTIRASLLRLLITGGTPECGLHTSGVWLVGAHVTETLDLRFAKGRGRCALGACRFVERPQLEQARLAQLNLRGSHLPGLFAQGIRVKGSLFLSNLTAKGTVAVNGARIGGQLACDGANLDGTNPDGSMGYALNAQGVEIGTGLLLSSLTAKGTVTLAGATIGGQLDCTEADLAGTNPDGTMGMALNAQGVQVGASLFFSSLTAKGTVAVAGARIGRQLSCEGANLDATNQDGTMGDALNAQGVEVGADLFLRALTAKGTVTLAGATIGGQLDCIRADLDATNPDGTMGKALNAQGVQVGADLFLTNLTAKGTVAVAGARIGGQLSCIGADLDATNPDGTMGRALNAQGVHVAEGFFFGGLKSVKGEVYLADAHVGELVDHAASWPTGAGEVYLDGFTYDRISAASTSVKDRLPWLERGSTFNGQFYPQPYTQLAKVLGEMGHGRDARKVLEAREQRLGHEARRARRIGPTGAALLTFENPKEDAIFLGTAAFDWVNRWVAGYGHAPMRSLGWLLALFLIATTLAHLTWQEGSFAPNSDVILTSPGWTDLVAIDCVPDESRPYGPCLQNPAAAWSTFGQDGLDWDTFSPYGYAADLVIPILDLGQTDAWAPSKDRGDMGWWLWWLRWVLAAAGWIVTGLGVAAVTGIMQRNAPD